MTNPNIAFTAPRVVEVLDKPVPSPGHGEVLVRTVHPRKRALLNGLSGQF